MESWVPFAERGAIPGPDSITELFRGVFTNVFAEPEPIDSEEVEDEGEDDPEEASGGDDAHVPAPSADLPPAGNPPATPAIKVEGPSPPSPKILSKAPSMASMSRAPSPERRGSNTELLQMDDPYGYKERIQRIEEQFESTVSLANHLEDYLLERYESAREADEAYLQEMDKLYTTMWRKTGLPMKPSRLSLDRAKLQPLGLLNSKALVAHYQRDQEKELGPPQTLVFMDASEENKGYYKLTAASMARQRSPDARQDPASLARSMTWAALTGDEVQTKIKEAQRRRRELSKRMPAEQWEEEKRVLRRMRHTLNFLRNPRFPAGKETPALEGDHGATARTSGGNRPSTSGRAASPQTAASTATAAAAAPAKGRPGTTMIGGDAPATTAPAAPAVRGGSLWSSAFAQRSVGITCQPPSVEFHEFEPGKTYEARVVFQNMGTMSRRVRLLPPYSKYFTVGELELPRGVEDNGLIAPGMQCATRIRFTPDSWADLDDTLTMVTELGRFQIPLVANREPPRLTMEESVEVGACFVGHSLTRTIEVRNIGGRGRFRLEPETYAKKAFPPRAGLLQNHKVGRGTTTSAELAKRLGLDLVDDEDLEPNTRDRRVYAGAFSVTPGEFLLDKDETVCLEVTYEPEEPGRHRAFIKFACDNCYKNDLILNAEACEAQSFLSHLDGREPYPGEIESGRPLFFGQVSPGGRVERSIMIRNDSKLPVRYEWRVEPVDLQSRAEGLPCVFTVFPSPKTEEQLEEEAEEVTKYPDGVLPPKKGTQFSVTFCPQSVARLHCRASLWLSYGSEETSPCDMFCLAVDLEGVGRPIEVAASPPALFAPMNLTPGQESVVRMSLTNLALDAPAVFSFPRERIPQGVSISPLEGTIPPGGASKVAVTVRGEQIGPVLHELHCTIRNGVALGVQLQAQVVGPPVKLATAAVDFGLVQVDTDGNACLRLTNASDVSAAAYRLEVRAPPGKAAATDGGRQLTVAAFGITMDPPEGVLGPEESIDVRLTCRPTACGAHRATLVVHVDGCSPRLVALRADVLEPQLVLDSDVIDLGMAFVGVEQKITFWLKNLTKLPVAFEWDPDFVGDTEHMRMSIFPSEGVVKSGGSYRLRLTLVPTKAAPLEVRALCLVKKGNNPIALTVRADVQGLSVSYSIVKDVPISIEHRTEVLCAGPSPVFDYGNTCRVGETQTQVLYLQNNTGIEAPFAIWAESFGLRPRPRVGRHSSYIQALQSVDNSMTRAGGGGGGGGGYPNMMAGANRAASPRNTLRSPNGNQTATGRGSLAQQQQSSGISLGDDQEQKGPFRSDLGKTMMTLRKQQQESEGVLGAGTGLAIEISPSEGVIPPFKDCYVRVTCHTNMYGTYTDTLHCAIGTLEAKRLPLRIGVIGTPLVLHKNRRLIRGLPSQPLHDQTAISLQFSDAIFGAPTETRTFYVFNTSPMEMEVEWDALRTIIHRDLPDDIDYVEVKMRSALGVLSVDLDPLDYTDGKLPAMYTVEPSMARIPGGGSASFTACFVPPKREELTHVPGCRVAEVTEMQHWGMLVGRQRLITTGLPRSSIADGELKLVTWTHGNPVDRAGRAAAATARNLRRGASGVAIKELPEEEALTVEAEAAAAAAAAAPAAPAFASVPEGEEAAVLPPAAEAAAAPQVPEEPASAAATESEATAEPASAAETPTPISVPIIATPAATVAVAAVAAPPAAPAEDEEPRVQCILRGSMHPFAGPPDVPLQPLRVALMARNIGCRLQPAETGLTSLKFSVHANLGSSHPTFLRAATFTNTLQIPMVVAISAKGELSPFAIVGVTPSAPQDASLDLTVMTPEGHAKVGSHIPARENIEVSVKFTEPEELEQSVKDYNLHGFLQMVYKNGDIQRFPLEAEVVHPEVQLGRKDLDFKITHIRAPKTLRVTLKNPTKADCRWEAVEKDQKPRFKDAPDAAARIGPFIVRPSGGVIPGRGLGMPKTQEISITYEPTQAKFDDREISFAVYKGRPADLYASGEGSFNEEAVDYLMTS